MELIMERAYRKVDFRSEGRKLSGQIIAYGDISPGHRERFLPGAFTLADAVPLNLGHNQLVACGWFPGGGVEIRDSEAALTMAAELPPLPAADRALKEVRSGSLSGLSVEFIAEKEKREGGIRIIEKAQLVGIGLVDEPSYPGSKVEARREMRGPDPDRERQFWHNQRRAVSGKMPLDATADCRCQGKDCNQVKFLPGSFDKTIQGAESGDRDISATTGSNGVENILGSTRQGTLRLTATDDGGMNFGIAAATGAPALLALIQSATAAPPIARPIIDLELSKFEDEILDGELVRVFSEVYLRSLLIKWADTMGWPPLVIDEFVEAGVDEFGTREAKKTRRALSWL